MYHVCMYTYKYVLYKEYIPESQMHVHMYLSCSIGWPEADG